MNLSHKDMERIEQRASARALLELELERDLKDVEEKVRQTFQRSMKKAEPKTMNEALRSGINSPAVQGGQLLKQIAETHRKTREKKIFN